MKSFLQIIEENTKKMEPPIVEEKVELPKSEHHGMFKAIFVSGGPGSGKDIVIREAITDTSITEINATLALSILRDKHKLSEQTKDFRREAIRNRGALVINGTTTEYEDICDIKEELEDLGYDTMMIFVNTNNEASKKRNAGLERMLDEDVRYQRWTITQEISQIFNEKFSKYLEFDNSLDLTEATKEQLTEKQEDISIISEMSNWFLSMPITNEIAEMWLYKNKKFNINKMFEQIVDRTEHTPVTAYGKRNREQTVSNQLRNLRATERQHDLNRKMSTLPKAPNAKEVERQHDLAVRASMQTLKNRFRFEDKNVSENQTNCEVVPAKGNRGTKKLKLLDNIAPGTQLTRKAGRADSVKDGDVASNSDYIWRTYEAAGQTTIVAKEKKPTRFQQDNDTEKTKKLKDSKNQGGKVLRVPGVSPEYDTRGSGTVYPMSGLGNVTYSEQTENKYKSTAEVTRKSFSKFRTESIDSPSDEMGVTGGEYGASNKEPMDTLNKIPTNPKKKTKK